MKKRMKRTAVLVGFLAFLAAALLVPERLCRLTEQGELGKLQTIQLTYQPYEISRYDTFADKLAALETASAESLENGYPLFHATFDQGEFPKDDELLSLVNTQLQKLSDCGALPQPLKATAIIGKQSSQAYSIVPQEKQQSFYYWILDCETESGTVTVKMDSEFHQIYSYFADTNWTWEQLKLFLAQDDTALAKSWENYWGVSGAAHEEETAANGYYSITDAESDSWRSVSFTLSSVQVMLNLQYNLYESAAQISFGLDGFE